MAHTSLFPNPSQTRRIPTSAHCPYIELFLKILIKYCNSLIFPFLRQCGAHCHYVLFSLPSHSPPHS